jgi:hypothetical protein
MGEKYDCPGIQRLIATWLGNALRTGVLGHGDLFVIACNLGLNILAADIVSVTYGRVAARPRPVSMQLMLGWGELKAPGRLDLGCFEDEMWLVTPQIYSLALKQARKEGSGKTARARFLKVVGTGDHVSMLHNTLILAPHAC